MILILFSVTIFAILDYSYRFMGFVSTDLAEIAKFLCFYSKSGLKVPSVITGILDMSPILYPHGVGYDSGGISCGLI